MDREIAGGAMGVQVWLPLPVGSDWRWQLNRDDTRCYPIMRLFQQQAFGAWPPVIAGVSTTLSDLARARQDERRER
jgi:hypothetical protein